jgi:pimeloyl-ACP methyl ester carboxylesterase
VLLHGYSDNSRSWSLVLPHLGDRRIVALDLRGHGGSAAPACCYGIDSLVHDLEGALDALGIERADIAGHSLGSITAAVFAARHPDRVDRLVLVGTGLSVPPAAADAFWQVVPALEAGIDPDGPFMLAWSATPTPVDPTFLALKRSEAAAVPFRVWLGALESMTMTDWSWFARRIEAPTLVLWGDRDILFDAPSQDRLRGTLPAAVFETYEGLGHNLHWEAPEAVGARIAGFLDQ